MLLIEIKTTSMNGIADWITVPVSLYSHTEYYICTYFMCNFVVPEIIKSTELFFHCELDLGLGHVYCISQ